jgi:enoyl-CoA hydratase
VIERASERGVRVLTLAHGKANALDVELCEALAAEVAAFAASADRALVVTGRAAIFSAGVDLKRVASGGAAYVRRFLPALERAFEALFALERPLVMAINGHAIAGGFVIAEAGDRRVLARGDATLGAPELQVGVPFPPIAVEILRAALPAERLASTLLGGEIVSADEAFARRCTDELVAPEALLPRAIAAARELAAAPARSYALTKRALRAPALESLAARNPAASREVLAAWASDEVLAAVRAYAERTLGASSRSQRASNDSTTS